MKGLVAEALLARPMGGTKKPPEKPKKTPKPKIKPKFNYYIESYHELKP